VFQKQLGLLRRRLLNSPQSRARDFELVNEGYIGYTNLGYSAREVDLLVWLETLRDKQCEDRACELGVPRPGHEAKGGFRSRSTSRRCCAFWGRASSPRRSN